MNLPIKVSQQVLTLKKEVDLLFGKEIPVFHDPGINGRMMANAEGNIYYRSVDEFTESGFVEELLHIKLDAEEHPHVACGNETIQAILEGLSHHQIIYPIMKSMGYDPHEDEAVKKQLDKLEEIVSKGDTGSLTQAVFALLYARCKLECNTESVHQRCSAIYSMPELSPAKEMGERITGIVKDCNLPPKDRGPMLHECIQILGLEDHVHVVGKDGW